MGEGREKRERKRKEDSPALEERISHFSPERLFPFYCYDFLSTCGVVARPRPFYTRKGKKPFAGKKGKRREQPPPPLYPPPPLAVAVFALLPKIPPISGVYFMPQPAEGVNITISMFLLPTLLVSLFSIFFLFSFSLSFSLSLEMGDGPPTSKLLNSKNTKCHFSLYNILFIHTTNDTHTIEFPRHRK